MRNPWQVPAAIPRKSGAGAQWAYLERVIDVIPTAANAVQGLWVGR